jgi:hypothetical protein
MAGVLRSVLSKKKGRPMKIKPMLPARAPAPPLFAVVPDPRPAKAESGGNHSREKPPGEGDRLLDWTTGRADDETDLTAW